MSFKPEIVVDAHAELGEGPVWDAEESVLYWVDIDRHQLHRFDGSQNTLVTTLRVPLAAVALRRNGGIIAAAGNGFAFIDERGAVNWLASVPKGDRMNDGKCDPAGRFLAGTLTTNIEVGASALYRYDPDDRLLVLLPNVTLSNGLDWSPDGTLMYYVDTTTRRIDVFDYGKDNGTLQSRRCLVDLQADKGNPDGLTVDGDGRLWVAMCGAGEVRCYSSEGRLEETVSFPTQNITSLTFGGRALSELFITSGRFDLGPEELKNQPCAGALFKLTPGVTGRLPNRFAA